MAKYPGKSSVILICSFWVCSALFTLISMAAAPSSKKAVKIFEEQCNECHSVVSEGLAAMEFEEDEEVEISDISGTGAKYDAEFLRQWLLREVEIDGEKHEKKFKGGEKDLEAMVAWLVTLREEAD